MAPTFEDPNPARFISWGSRAKCAICKKPVDVHEATRAATCESPACKSRYLGERLQLELQKERQIWQMALDRRAEDAAALGIDPEQLPAGVLPSNELPLSTLPKERRRAFESRLRRKIDEAIAIHAAAAGSPPKAEDSSKAEDGARSEPASPKLSRMLEGSCALCRGECCTPGRDHAFISPETILRYLEAHPGSDPGEILHAYVAHLGEETYEGSCVYHGRGGCQLPREMRSDTCNEYVCQGLEEFRLRLESSGAKQGFAVAMVDANIVRSASLGRDESRS